MFCALAGLFLVAPGVRIAAAADVFAGAAIYEAHCANCHGKDGKPIIAGTPDFTRGEGLLAPDGVLLESLKRGKGLMPGFDRIISERDLLNVLAFSRTLQR